MRQVILIFIAALMIGYDLFILNGHYVRFVITWATRFWNAIESFVLGLL